MPENLTDSETFTSPIVVPTDGDAGLSTSVKTGFQGLANRTALLHGAYRLAGWVGRSVDDGADANGVIASTSSTIYATLTGWSPGEPIIALPKTGEILLVHANLNVQFTGGGNAGGYVKLAIYDGTNEYDLKGAKFYQSNNDGGVARGIALIGYYTFASETAHTIRVKGKCLSGSDTLNWVGQAGIILQWLKATP